MTDNSILFIHSPSIPLTLKDTNHSVLEVGHHPELDAVSLDAGHEAILEMHANSEASALFYVVVVLVLYVLALVAFLTKYLRTDSYAHRLTRLYDEFMSRDRFANRAPTPADKDSQAQKPNVKKTVQESNVDAKPDVAEFVV